MYDEVDCRMPWPAGLPAPVGLLQTHSLGSGQDRFAITPGGRLLFHRCLHERADGNGGLSGFRLVDSEGAIDTGYHGDLDLVGSTTDGQVVSFTPRFTHGSLEWVRPLEALSALQLRLLDHE